MQWVLRTALQPRVAALASIVLMSAVALLSVVGDGGANTPELIMPNGICPPTC
jgi:hypothetical protein